VHTPVVPCTCVCPNPCDICQKADCVNGNCVSTSKCNIVDNCYNYTGACNVTTGCTKKIKCDDGNPCMVKTCNPSDGICTSAPMNCDDGNSCTDDICVAGVCTHPATNCNPTGDKCKTSTCDDRTGCTLTAIDVKTVCDDFNACTEDICDAALGCQQTNKSCVSGATCVVDSCTPVRGCFSDATVCPAEGKCGIGVCTNNTCTSTRPDLCEDEIIGLGLGAGAIVGIVIAAIVAAALLGVGAYKGIQAYNASKDLEQSGNTNPLYEAGGQYGENKLFGDYQAFK